MQIFASESKFEDVEYQDDMSRGFNNSNLYQQDNKSVYSEIQINPDLQEQLRQTRVKRKLMVSHTEADIQRKKEPAGEEARHLHDDYYQNNNNYFHTGTFQGDDEDDKYSTPSLNNK